MNVFEITTIQFFPATRIDQLSEDEFVEIKTYSANIVLNDEFIVQLSGDGNQCDISIPTSNEQSWKHDDRQDWAYENLDLDEIIKFLESEGIENNYYFLEQNANETY